ncbi:hypothetical protein YB2330_002330 [Saitoella coloradoensis]
MSIQISTCENSKATSRVIAVREKKHGVYCRLKSTLSFRNWSASSTSSSSYRLSISSGLTSLSNPSSTSSSNDMYDICWYIMESMLHDAPPEKQQLLRKRKELYGEVEHDLACALMHPMFTESTVKIDDFLATGGTSFVWTGRAAVMVAQSVRTGGAQGGEEDEDDGVIEVNVAIKFTSRRLDYMAEGIKKESNAMDILKSRGGDMTNINMSLCHFSTKWYHVMVTPLMSWDLENFLRSKDAYTGITMSDGTHIEVNHTRLRYMFRGIANGLSVLHANHIAHGDLKTENILLEPRPVAGAEPGSPESWVLVPYLADFGHAKCGSKRKRPTSYYYGTYEFAAPEFWPVYTARGSLQPSAYLNKKHSLLSGDVFALGCVLYSLYNSGKIAYWQMNPFREKFLVSNKDKDDDTCLDPYVEELDEIMGWRKRKVREKGLREALEGCLRGSKVRRWTMREVMECKLIKKI